MKSASVYKRSDGWYVHADYQTTVGVWIEGPPRIKLGNRASSGELGHAAIEALAGSEQGIPHPTVRELEIGFQPMLELADVKTWAAFARHARNVSLRTSSDGRWLIIEPWENVGMKRGFVPISNVNVQVHIDAQPDEIGEAIIKAMALCVPQDP
jgi:hypothetical protein